MKRRGIKITLLLIALCSAAYWLQPPQAGPSSMLAAWSVLWTLIALAAFKDERAENWGYRLGSLLGVALATVEGAAWLLSLDGRPGLAAMALLHAIAFPVAVTGRYQKAGSRLRR